MDERAALMLERVAQAFEDDPDRVSWELQNAADEIRYGWVGATVTPYAVLGNLLHDD
jgi:hypothetical protein